MHCIFHSPTLKSHPSGNTLWWAISQLQKYFSNSFKRIFWAGATICDAGLIKKPKFDGESSNIYWLGKETSINILKQMYVSHDTLNTGALGKKEPPKIAIDCNVKACSML